MNDIQGKHNGVNRYSQIHARDFFISNRFKTELWPLPVSIQQVITYTMEKIAEHLEHFRTKVRFFCTEVR